MSIIGELEFYLSDESQEQLKVDFNKLNNKVSINQQIYSTINFLNKSLILREIRDHNDDIETFKEYFDNSNYFSISIEAFTAVKDLIILHVDTISIRNMYNFENKYNKIFIIELSQVKDNIYYNTFGLKDPITGMYLNNNIFDYRINHPFDIMDSNFNKELKGTIRLNKYPNIK